MHEYNLKAVQLKIENNSIPEAHSHQSNLNNHFMYLILGAAGLALGGRIRPVLGLPDPGLLAAAVLGRVVEPAPPVDPPDPPEPGASAPPKT